MQKLSEGFEYLDGLARINGKPMQSFESFSRYLEKKAREKGVPLNGQFELTPLCNFDCKMCYVHLDGDQLKGREILPVPVWKELMTQAWKAGMVKAALTGGECLAYAPKMRIRALALIQKRVIVNALRTKICVL